MDWKYEAMMGTRSERKRDPGGGEGIIASRVKWSVNKNQNSTTSVFKPANQHTEPTSNTAPDTIEIGFVKNNLGVYRAPLCHHPHRRPFSDLTRGKANMHGKEFLYRSLSLATRPGPHA